MTDELHILLDTAAIFRYHQSLTEVYGGGSTGSLGWLQPEGQQSRFEVLSRIGNLNNCSVLDAGCGHGDQLPFLKERYPAVRYYGLEQIPTLLKVAAERYQAIPEATFLLGDFMQADLPVTDYVLVSGSLSYRHHCNDFIYQAIEKLFSHCRLGFGFNLLSGGVVSSSSIVAYEPATVHQFCQTLSSKTKLHHAYWKDDFTIFMYR